MANLVLLNLTLFLTVHFCAVHGYAAIHMCFTHVYASLPLLREHHGWSRKESKESFQVGCRLVEVSREMNEQRVLQSRT